MKPIKVLEAMYFTESQTGGGCTALTYGAAEPHGFYLMVTTAGDPSAPTDETKMFTAGRYDCDTRDQVGEVVTGTFTEILKFMRPYIDTSAWADGIDAILRATLDAAALEIQTALGVKTGDLAGQYFSGEQQEAFDELALAYIEAELAQ